MDKVQKIDRSITAPSSKTFRDEFIDHLWRSVVSFLDSAAVKRTWRCGQPDFTGGTSDSFALLQNKENS
jgi:hypothetical protein